MPLKSPKSINIFKLSPSEFQAEETESYQGTRPAYWLAKRESEKRTLPVSTVLEAARSLRHGGTLVVQRQRTIYRGGVPGRSLENAHIDPVHTRFRKPKGKVARRVLGRRKHEKGRVGGFASMSGRDPAPSPEARVRKTIRRLTQGTMRVTSTEKYRLGRTASNLPTYPPKCIGCFWSFREGLGLPACSKCFENSSAWTHG